MAIITNILRAIKRPRELGRAFMTHTAPYWKNDKLYLQLLFYFIMGHKLNLKNPKSYNQKLQWLKLYNRKPEFSTMVDKYEAKKFVSEKIGHKYIIKTIAIWDKVEEIDISNLPDRFVLKTTHDGGSMGVVICRNKKLFDLNYAKYKLQRSMNRDTYLQTREWPYKNIKRRIIAEEFIEDSIDKDLHDYKILCFEGNPKLIEFHSGRFTKDQHQEIYDTNWNLTNISQGGSYASSGDSSPKPECLEEMLELTHKLCNGLHHIRVDWYILNKSQLKFGELTFFDGSGFERFDDYKHDLLLGSWININNENCN